MEMSPSLVEMSRSVSSTSPEAVKPQAMERTSGVKRGFLTRALQEPLPCPWASRVALAALFTAYP